MTLARKLGYKVLGTTERGETNMARSITYGDYPRFHIYAKEEGDTIIINLHLDQKRPSYEGSSAHSGEYDGDLVEREAERIKKMA
mgnify:CR=1 FL=1